MTEECRHHPNPYENVIDEEQMVRIRRAIVSKVDQQQNRLALDVVEGSNGDISVYTGSAGVAWTALKVAAAASRRPSAGSKSQEELGVWAKAVLQQAVEKRQLSKQSKG